MPPTVQRVWVEGSGPKRSPTPVAAFCSVACTVPGCTTAERASASTERTRSRWREASTTMPVPTALPAIEVPAPRIVSGTPVVRTTSRTAASSSVCRGRTTTSGSSR